MKSVIAIAAAAAMLAGVSIAQADDNTAKTPSSGEGAERQGVSGYAEQGPRDHGIGCHATE